MTRDSFVFYRSFKNAISKLNDADRLAAYDALIEYGLDGLENAEGVSAALLEAFKPLMDANNRKYENGKKGGRPKKEENPEETTGEPNENQTETKPKLNVKCERLNVNKERKKERNALSEKRKPKARQPSFMDQRVYNYDELEKSLLTR